MARMARKRTCECGGCRKCEHREYMRWYYHSTEERKEKAKALVRKRYRRLRATDPDWNEKERERNRLRRPKAVTTRAKNRARLRAYRAVQAGKIQRRVMCQGCRRKKKLTMHHKDYDKPLEVIWLCWECHGHRHRVYPF